MPVPTPGGMGAYSPVPIAGAELVDQVMVTAVAPTLHALADEGIAYRGVLYVGIMLTADGPKVLEYNVRFGDPECQVVLPRLDGDLGELCLASASGGALEARFVPDACVTVVLASEGYPVKTRTGDVIAGLDDAASQPGVTVFHAATAHQGDDVVTAGGRVLDVTALGGTIAEARERAYDAVGRISWPGMQYRTDIAAGCTYSGAWEGLTRDPPVHAQPNGGPVHRRGPLRHVARGRDPRHRGPGQARRRAARSGRRDPCPRRVRCRGDRGAREDHRARRRRLRRRRARSAWASPRARGSTTG